jgi:hypothetical protein
MSDAGEDGAVREETSTEYVGKGSEYSDYGGEEEEE